VFIGAFHHQVDGKGRIAVPAQLRRGLESGSIIAIGPERRLVLYPPDEWHATEERYRIRADNGPDQRRFMRQLYASARPVDLDGQGRLLLDAQHRAYAEITDRAVFIGMSNVVELVGASIWEADQSAFDPDAFTDLGDRVNQATVAGPA
jgi:MraZ protein